MKEADFLKLYKEKRGLKNVKEAKKRVDLFWDCVFEALEKEDEVKFKDWGLFKIKEAASRKVVSPKGGVSYTEPKRKLKFRAGLKFRERVNTESGANE